MVTLNTEARLEALEKVMEEQANRLTAIEAKLDKREAIQKSQFDLIRQQFAALGSLLGQKELASIPAVDETTKVVYLPPPIVAPPSASVTEPLVLSSPPSLTPPLIATAHPAPNNHVGLLTPPAPPHLTFPLQRFSPLPFIQQPTIFLPVSSASHLLHPATDPSVMPQAMILLKELWLRLLRLAGMDVSVHPSVGWLKSFGKQIDVRPWKIWAVF